VLAIASSNWDKAAIAMAEDSLQARYGFTTADQKQRALRQALRHLTKLEIKYFTGSKQNPYAGCGISLVQSLRDQ